MAKDVNVTLEVTTGVTLPESVLLVHTTFNESDNVTEILLSARSSRNEILAQFEVATLAVIFVLTCAGNVSVLVGIVARRIKMTRMYYFLLHLCISDLITAFFSVLPQLAWDMTHRFKGGDFMCKAVKYVQILGPYLSSYVLTVTAIDRYQAICFPLSNCTWTPRRSKLMIAGAWAIALLCCIPQVFIFSYQDISQFLPSIPLGTYDCWGTFVQPWGERAYVTWYAISVFFVPLVILVFTYSSICKTIWKNIQQKHQSVQLPSLNSSSSTLTTSVFRVPTPHPTTQPRRTLLLVGRSYRFCGKGQIEVRLDDECSSVDSRTTFVLPRSHSIRGLSRAKIKTIKITVVVIVCYVICSSPFLCVQLWAQWYPHAQEMEIWQGPAITMLMLLASLNSCMNPWIYLFFNRNLISTLRHLCTCDAKASDSSKMSFNTKLDANASINTTSKSSPTENDTCTALLPLTCHGYSNNGTGGSRSVACNEYVQ